MTLTAQVSRVRARYPRRFSSSLNSGGCGKVFLPPMFTQLMTQIEDIFRLPLGDSTAIMFSEPAFTMTLSLIILRSTNNLKVTWKKALQTRIGKLKIQTNIRDHCGLWRVLVAITTVVGVGIELFNIYSSSN